MIRKVKRVNIKQSQMEQVKAATPARIKEPTDAKLVVIKPFLFEKIEESSIRNLGLNSRNSRKKDPSFRVDSKQQSKF